MPTNPSDHSDPSRAGIPEDAAHRLLARAAELDARIGTTLTLEQLREVAAEAGIGRDAFEAALREYEAGALELSAFAHSAGNATTTKHLPLVERLASHRPLAALMIMLSAALASPGDLFWTTLLVSAPAYALYELGIALGRSRLRKSGAPPASPEGGPHAAPAQSKTAADDKTTQRLLLRPA